MGALTPREQTIALFAGVGVILIVASLVGFALKRAVAKGAPHAVIDNLNARVKAWWVMVAVIGLAFMGGRAGVTLLFLFVSFAALREFLSLSYTRTGDHYALIVSFLRRAPGPVRARVRRLVRALHDLHPGLRVPVPADPRRRRGRHDALPGARVEDAMGPDGLGVLHLARAGVADARHPGLRGTRPAADRLPRAGRAVERRAAVRVGQAGGRRPVAPLVSPSKTWEGLVGGIASATAIGAALYWITPFAPWQAALMALAICVMGFFGGLVMSAIKRDRGVKDWGSLIEGHGGMLDRLDSVAFAAPVFFHLTRYFWT
jgi:phosphatidate cytidylyltransferase